MAEKRGSVVPFVNNIVAKRPHSASNLDESASSVGRPTALSEDDLRRQVQHVVCQGTIRESWHAKNDRSYRNVSLDDIQHMLRNDWSLVGKPTWKPDYNNWVYKLKGQDIEDDDLTLVITVSEERVEILIITKY